MKDTKSKYFEIEEKILSLEINSVQETEFIKELENVAININEFLLMIFLSITSEF